MRSRQDRTRAAAFLAAAGLALSGPATAADTDPVWLTIHEDNTTFIPFDIVADNAGNSFTIFNSGGEDIGINRFNPDGLIAWTTIFQGPVGVDSPVAVSLSADQQHVYALGRSRVAGFANDDFVILKVDTASGVIEWTRFYDGGDLGLDLPFDVAGLADGGVVATGGIDTATEQRDIGSVKFDAEGNLQWEQRFTGQGPFLFENDEGRFVFPTPDGDAIVIGTANNPFNFQDTMIFRYDGVTGALEWQATYDTGSDDIPADARLSPEGDPVIFGGAIGGNLGLGQWFAARFDAQTGDELWRTTIDPGLRDFPRAVFVGPKGDVFVNGTTDPDSNSSNNNNNVIVAGLDGATGSLLWIDEFGDNGVGDAENIRALYANADSVYSFGFTVSESVVTGEPDGLVLKHDAATGQRLEVGLVDTSEPGSPRTENFLRLWPNAEGDVFAIGERGGAPTPNEFFLAKFDLGDTAPTGCNAADIAEPLGVLDLADVQAFIAAFVAGDSAADIAPPSGVLDLADVQTFVSAFTGGCVR